MTAASTPNRRSPSQFGPWLAHCLSSLPRSCPSAPPPNTVPPSLPPPAHTTTAKVWSELAHNTSGWVVPVMSANLHEIRAYNRLAALARGRVMVILQVCVGGGSTLHASGVRGSTRHTG